MKKTLVLLFGLLILSTNAFAAESATTAATQSIFETMKNAIIQDVSNTVQNVATSALNQVKLVNDKTQLEKKKKELEELEASNTFFLVKIYKRIKLNSDIDKLEKEIAELEKSTTTTTK